MAALAMKMVEDAFGDGTASCQAMGEQDVLDCISEMLRQEEHYVCGDYLGCSAPVAAAAVADPRKRDAIDESCRSKMAEWIFHVIDSTRLQRETASVAMNFLDRFLCTESHRAAKARVDRKEYQLAAMTCLYIAVKIREPFEMDAPLMSRLSRGLHRADEITALEYEILVSLRWKMSGPTPFQFVNYILEILPDSAKVVAPTLYEHSHFQTELAVGDYAFVPFIRQSTIAVAAILNSLGSVAHDTVPYYDCIQFVRSISSSFELDIDSPLVNAVRGRLLESFARSSGCGLSLEVLPIPKQVELGHKLDHNAFAESPACVSKEMAISLEEYMP